jgi:HD superfamily phosphohydrolase
MIKADQEIRDPVHGLIRLTDQEIRIIDAPVFQRLRRIKQLALANYVYPGALHTRFEHSLGTLHVAGRILETVAKKERLCDTDIEVVRLAALLHDIGHGPFSHVSEFLLDKYYDSESGPAGTREKIHEKVTLDIITHEPSIAESLTDEQREAVCRLIRGTSQKDMRRDIVSSNLDADKIDYLSRDAYYAGVKYGTIDSDKIIDSFTMVARGQETFLAIEESAIFAVEQLIFAKHHMTQQVYAHRIRVITDYMIVRGLILAVEDGLAEVEDLYSYDASPEFCQNYVQYDDERIFEVVLGSNCKRPKSIFERLRSRNLFKQVLRLPLKDNYVDDPIALLHLMNLSSADKEGMQDRVASEIGCDPWEVIVEVKNVKNPAYQAPGVLDPENLLVMPGNGRPRAMNTYDELGSAQLPSFDTLHVIAPHTWSSVEDQKSLSVEKLNLEETIKGIVLDCVGGTA